MPHESSTLKTFQSGNDSREEEKNDPRNKIRTSPVPHTTMTTHLQCCSTSTRFPIHSSTLNIRRFWNVRTYLLTQISSTERQIVHRTLLILRRIMPTSMIQTANHTKAIAYLHRRIPRLSNLRHSLRIPKVRAGNHQCSSILNRRFNARN
jgi:hypothetical protein